MLRLSRLRPGRPLQTVFCVTAMQTLQQSQKASSRSDRRALSGSPRDAPATDPEPAGSVRVPGWVGAHKLGTRITPEVTLLTAVHRQGHELPTRTYPFLCPQFYSVLRSAPSTSHLRCDLVLCAAFWRICSLGPTSEPPPFSCVTMDFHTSSAPLHSGFSVSPFCGP